MISLSECDHIYMYDHIFIITRGRPKTITLPMWSIYRNQALMADTLKKTFRMFSFFTKCAQQFVWDTNTDLETSEYLVLSWPTFHSIRTSLDTVHNWRQFVGLNDSPVHKCLPTSIEHSFIFSNQFLKMFNI